MSNGEYHPGSSTAGTSSSTTSLYTSVTTSTTDPSYLPSSSGTPYPPSSFSFSSSSSSSSSASTGTGTDTSTTPLTISSTTTPTLPQSSVESTASSSSAAAAASTPSGNTSNTLTTSSASTINVGAVAGGVIGGVVFLILLILGLILCRRARLKKHVAPSSQFAETIKRGELPVLRLDSGVEIVPSPTHYHVPLPLRQDSYYTSPAMSDMKLPDGIGGSEEQSERHSLEKPLQPLRRPGYQGSNESVTMGNTARRVSSIGSSQEFWSRDTGKFDIRKDYLRSTSPLLIETSYAPMMQNTYPMQPSRAVDTLQDAYADLWKLSVAPMTRTRPISVRNGADTQPLPPLRPLRRSVDVGSGRKL
ncbi:hypothetical protein DFJ58DRAFT_306448 [Suillus subalutaceus]|uniref:uncharacterized protein n=1 Tax=Suillus subalutaceus TaxID=48586 RepID=UPI001B87F02C|nr:uncharacterized protein DFJ58DRAFT_306448 [Suillus subalutaceus]KAG1858403.1 hypothetical protein DFJ58DRAFT_306448 [Suillus subalutaceus]